MTEMNVYQKVAELRDFVDKLPKDAYNPHFKFHYTSSNAVLSAVRAKMKELGLLVIISVDRTNVILTSNAFLTEMWFVFLWVNVDKPDDRIEIKWYAQGKDSNELGPGKAYTYGEKYFFLKELNIATDGDDPDWTADNKKPADKKTESTKTESEKKEPDKSPITEKTLSTLRDFRAKYESTKGKDDTTKFDKSLKQTASPMFGNFIGLTWEKATEDQGQWAIEQYKAQGV